MEKIYDYVCGWWGGGGIRIFYSEFMGVASILSFGNTARSPEITLASSSVKRPGHNSHQPVVDHKGVPGGEVTPGAHCR